MTNQAAQTMPTVPQAFFDEFGVNADDRVMDYGRACYEAGLNAGRHPDALPDGTLSKSTAKRLAAASVSERAREWEEWNDGDSSFLSVADSDARYEVSFAIHEGHSGVWRSYFNPDTEREPIKETHLGTFASKERAKKECEDHCNRAGNYRDNDGGVPYVY